MKKLTISILTCGLIASSLYQANAATMRVSADNGATWTYVDDNGPFDANPTPGAILFIGTSTSGWNLVVASAVGLPAVGTAITPRMDVSTGDTSSGPAQLIVQMSDTGFTPFPNETFVASISTTTAGTVTYNTYRDTGNVLFGSTATYAGDPVGISPSPTAALLTTEGPFVGGPNIVGNSVVVPDGGSGPYSLTVETIIHHPSAGFTTTDALLFALPPQPACTITGVTISDTSWNKFNIPSGTSPVVWVHAHLNKITGIPTNSISTVQFTGVTITLNGTSYSLPDGVLTFDPSAPSTITTTYTGGKWQTLINPNYLSDEMFFTGAAIPVTASVAAGAKATLSFTSVSSVEGIAYSWQWSAAVYTFWPANWNDALIQPFHGNGLHAGTPLNTKVQKSLIQGPRGGGGSNFTGSWSATGSAECQ